jgi:hypothetical protein
VVFGINKNRLSKYLNRRSLLNLFQSRQLQ